MLVYWNHTSAPCVNTACLPGQAQHPWHCQLTTAFCSVETNFSLSSSECKPLHNPLCCGDLIGRNTLSSPYFVCLCCSSVAPYRWTWVIQMFLHSNSTSTAFIFCDLGKPFKLYWASLGALTVKNPPQCRVGSLGQEDPLEKGMATHSSILAWKISWTEEHGRLQSVGSQRVGHDWATNSFNLF